MLFAKKKERIVLIARRCVIFINFIKVLYYNCKIFEPRGFRLSICCCLCSENRELLISAPKTPMTAEIDNTVVVVLTKDESCGASSPVYPCWPSMCIVMVDRVE